MQLELFGNILFIKALEHQYFQSFMPECNFPGSLVWHGECLVQRGSRGVQQADTRKVACRT